MTMTNPSKIEIGDTVVDRTRTPDENKTRMKVDGFVHDAFENLYVALSDAKTGKGLGTLRATQVKRAPEVR